MNCTHETIDCPNHAGAYDCTPFCQTCEGSQGYCPTCNVTARDKQLIDVPNREYPILNTCDCCNVGGQWVKLIICNQDQYLCEDCDGGDDDE